MINFSEFKKFFMFNLIGSLIISAVVAVITVLTGEFNDITRNVLWTLGMVVIHSIVSLAFIWDDEKQDTFNNLIFFINILFILIVLSFMTSILNIWDILQPELVWNLYQTYLVIGIAALHGDILSKVLNKEKYMDSIVYINYIFMFLVVVILQPIIYSDMTNINLSDMYYRVLSAIGIIDGTLSVLTIIFYKLYLNKHPKIENPLQNNLSTLKPTEQQKSLSPWVWIAGIFLLLQAISILLRMF